MNKQKDMRNFNDVNDKYECLQLLLQLNETIHMLYKLDDKYYTDYIFNQCTTVLDELKKQGMTEQYFYGLASKFETFRSILYGDQIDWDMLVKIELEKTLKEQHDELKTNNEIMIKNYREIEMLKKELREAKK